MWLLVTRLLRLAWASDQSDQSLRCLHKANLDPWFPTETTSKTDQTARMRTLVLLILSCRDSNLMFSIPDRYHLERTYFFWLRDTISKEHWLRDTVPNIFSN